MRSWLRRQASNQIFQRPLRKGGDIQAVITSQPNEVIQVDYMYFYRNLTGEPVIDEEEEEEEISKPTKTKQTKSDSPVARRAPSAR
eukprot:COSAG04_NODE_399_length_14959_cov_28.238730_19_plen_85_part_01